MSTTDCEARQRSFPSVSALVGVPVGAEADDAGSPHPGPLPRDLLQERYQLAAVGTLLLAAPCSDVVRDACVGEPGLILGHDVRDRGFYNAHQSLDELARCARTASRFPNQRFCINTTTGPIASSRLSSRSSCDGSSTNGPGSS